MLMILFFIYGDRDEYLGKGVSRDMEIDKMTTCRLDMDSIGEFDIFFLEFDIIFFIHSIANTVFVQATEYFFSFSLETELELLSIELFLYFEGLFQALSRLILGFSLVIFYLCEAIWSDLSGESTGDE